MSDATLLESEETLRRLLLACGNNILLKGVSEAELPGLLDQYSDLFARWYEKSNLASGSPEAIAIVGEVTEVLGSVAAMHEAVLKLATDAQALTSADLKTIRSRGKGILAYVDTLPKRLSLNKSRKG